MFRTGFGCNYCGNPLHIEARGVPGGQQGPACGWESSDQLEAALRHRPTKAEWHHTFLQGFGLPCDAQCRHRKPSGRTLSLIDRIKDHYRIEDIASRLTDLRGYNPMTGKCPLHGEVHGTAFVVWPEDQKWKCFGACGIGGDVIDLMRACKERGIEWRENGAQTATRQNSASTKSMS